MPIYEYKKFDLEKIKEVMKIHPDHKFQIGMKRDWDFVHGDITLNTEHIPFNVESSWWDTPVLREYDSEGNFLQETETWKKGEYEDSEEHRKLQEKLLDEYFKRRG